MRPLVRPRRNARRSVAPESATTSGVSATHAKAGWPNLGKLRTRSTPDKVASVTSARLVNKTRAVYPRLPANALTRLQDRCVAGRNGPHHRVRDDHRHDRLSAFVLTPQLFGEVDRRDGAPRLHSPERCR